MGTPGRWWRTAAVGYYPPPGLCWSAVVLLADQWRTNGTRTQGWAGPGAGWLERITAPDVCARLVDPMLIVGQICPRSLHDASRRKWHPVVMLRRGEPDLLPSFLVLRGWRVRIHVCNTSLRVCRYLGSTTTIRRSLSRSLSILNQPSRQGSRRLSVKQHLKI